MGLAPTLSSPAPASGNKQAKSIYDDRLVEIALELKPGVMTKFSALAIFATGIKFGNANQNQCEVRIYNLTKEQRNYIIKQSSPLKQPRTLINMTLSVGRKSYGMFQLFTGQVIASDVTQPPDIGIILRGLSSNFLQGAISATQFGPTAPLSQIAQGIATQVKVNPATDSEAASTGAATGAAASVLSLDFQATDKQISNFSYTGHPINGIEKLGEAGAVGGGAGVDAFIDNNTLVVIDSDKARKGAAIAVNETTGMVGIPQVTQQGVNVTVMINPQIQLGGSIIVTSILNPAANGTYKIIKINFEIANRDVPFWYVLETSNLGQFQGTS